MNNMYGIIGVLFLALTINTESVLTEHEQFPEAESATNRDLLTQLINIIEEQARRRLQQHRQQQMHRGQMPSENEEVSGPGFTYQLPINYAPPIGDEVPFAVGPSNPKYYEKSDPNVNKPIYYNNILNADNETPVRLSSDGIPSYKLRAPMDVKPKINPFDDRGYEMSKSKDVIYREDLNNVELKKKMQETAMSNAYQSDVLKKHMELDAAMGMYVIALIAGVSAAVTVGLLAIGIGWYTLQKKAKAAADVEYPAYGVTGPNKDNSPSSGDRRLAQSAQMYHYQHQKQQIIQQMENQNTNDQNGSISDIETDEENEEGDYTVYECPGLAPTGDMEVKNPMFLDDPTPVVKDSTAADASAIDQTQPQQSNEKPINSGPATKK